MVRAQSADWLAKRALNIARIFERVDSASSLAQFCEWCEELYLVAEVDAALSRSAVYAFVMPGK